MLTDYSANFARHFARLVSLLLHDVGNVDEQKASLRALVTLNKDGPVVIGGQGWELIVNDQIVPGALTGVHDVAAQMGSHAIQEIRIARNAVAADLLGLARIIAASPAPGDGGALARQKLKRLGATGIELVTPASVEATTEAPTVVVASTATQSTPAPSLVKAQEEASKLLAQLVAPDVSKLTPDELLKQLDAAGDAEACTHALDDLVLLAEHSVRAGKTSALGEILHGIVSRDAGVPDGDVKRAYVMAIRRLSKPALLRGVATLIPKRPEHRQRHYEVLQRTGEEGAEAVIEQIAQAPTTEDRKAFFEVLGVLDAAIPALKRMLGDSRWFVVRNAADLLGELVATSAEAELVGLLRHADDRVRRSATNALLRLGTADALKGIYDAVNDTSPEVRLQATAAIATRRDGRTSTTLIRAIEDEHDSDVQIAMIAALGKVATPDAVQKLVKLAEPDGRLFRKKSMSLRVAAIQALGEARTPAAVTALKDLVADKEREVRDTANRALAHAGR